MPLERILIVEHDDSLRAAVALALRRFGYEVELASDICAALDILGAQPRFSVLLASLDLPAETGFELLRAVRKIDQQTAVIVTTTCLDAGLAACAGGAYDFLLLPLQHTNQVILAVERAAAHRRLALERDNLNERLLHNQELLRAITGATGDAVLAANTAGVLQVANPAAAQLLGPDCAEGSLANSSLPPTLTDLITSWQTISGSQTAVIETPWPDGSVQLVSLSPLRERGGSRQGWIAVLRDITHTRRIEELKTRLLAEAAARIRTPLAQATQTLVELNILTSQNRRVNPVVYRLTQIWKRIQDWGDDLSTLLRIDSLSELQSSSVRLQPVLQELVRSHCEPPDIHSGLHFEVQIDPNLPDVLADPELLRRLLYGLVNRAVGRSDPGCKIRLTARSHNHQIWISVSDEGPAVSTAELHTMFERTFVRDTGGSATGLEMALAKTIADRLQGQVWVGRHDQKGSTIYVCLPAQMQRSLY